MASGVLIKGNPSTYWLFGFNFDQIEYATLWVVNGSGLSPPNAEGDTL